MVAAFLQSYYGNSTEGQSVDAPTPTVTTRERFGVVTVHIGGEPYIISDIGMRMLEPEELLRAQFGEMADGWVLLGSKSQKVAGIGNSVCPHVARAIVKANVKLRRCGRVEVA
jgi:DNA (cytosine-5)-methyltransferase 1